MLMLLKRIIGLFIIFSPFTAYFALSGWVRFPVLLVLIVCVVFFIKLFIRRKIPLTLFTTINVSDLILICILLIIVCSLIVNGLDSRSINHTLAYGFTFFLYFIILKKIIQFEKIDFLFILKMFAISSFVCCAIIITDWALINFFNIGIRGYFVTVDHRTANMLYYEKAYFMTVGGVAEEPGSMAILLNIISPLGLLYLKLKQRSKYFMLLMAMHLMSLFFLFSVAGFISLIIAITIIFIISEKPYLKVRKIILNFVALILLLVMTVGTYFIFKYRDVVKDQLTEITNKVFLSDQDASADLRMNTWAEAIKNWKESPILGNGPGHGVSWRGSGYHSVYLTLLSDTGIFSLSLFIGFLVINFRKIAGIPVVYRKYLFISFLTSLIHFAVIGDYYHAPFWILLILIQVICQSQYFSANVNETVHSNSIV
jgi:O-antigen ligase